MGGGWRKLWFVLQNQLLLSYSSKEDYEKKLAPFKDLINLVPGTVIKPAAGARFTIETTANVVYTFVSEKRGMVVDKREAGGVEELLVIDPFEFSPFPRDVIITKCAPTGLLRSVSV